VSLADYRSEYVVTHIEIGAHRLDVVELFEGVDQAQDRARTIFVEFD
jgi:hypothetical protein